jgi:hypothetical protein
LSALDTLVDVDGVGLFDYACDCANGALSCASRTAFALVFHNLELNKTLADVAGALLVHDMCYVFITEITES